MFIKDQKNKKAINGYAELITKIRNEYAQLQKENNQLKMELQIYQQYVQNVLQNLYRKPSYVRPKRKIIQYYDESDESDSFISEVRKRPRKLQKKKKNKWRQYWWVSIWAWFYNRGRRSRWHLRSSK